MSVAPHASLVRFPYRPAPAGVALTAKEKRLVRESFLALEPAYDLVGQLFFRKLYRLDPFFRNRFAGPVEVQGRKFMAGLKLGIIAINYDDGLAPVLRLLGVRHRRCGIHRCRASHQHSRLPSLHRCTSPVYRLPCC